MRQQVRGGSPRPKWGHTACDNSHNGCRVTIPASTRLTM